MHSNYAGILQEVYLANFVPKAPCNDGFLVQKHSAYLDFVMNCSVSSKNKFLFPPKSSHGRNYGSNQICEFKSCGVSAM
jgi:hypothetical protein